MHGGLLAIVNREPTPYDRRAALVLHGSAGEILGGVRADYDVVVVGSGFGGAVAALRLAEKGYRRRSARRRPALRAGGPAEDELARPRLPLGAELGCRGIQRLTPLRDVLVLSGAGVGGGSLVYANTLYEPPASVWADERWGEELAPWYDQARRMLGVTRFPGDTPADEVMRGIAARLGVADTFEHTPVGVWFGEDGVDPYFGGAGPLRNGCDLRGACMTGCPHGAKNSLDRNYLWLAERAGAEIHADTKVQRLVPAGHGLGQTHGHGGSRRVEESSTPARSSSRRACSARSASSSAPGSAGLASATRCARTPR